MRCQAYWSFLADEMVGRNYSKLITPAINWPCGHEPTCLPFLLYLACPTRRQEATAFLQEYRVKMPTAPGGGGAHL